MDICSMLSSILRCERCKENVVILTCPLDDRVVIVADVLTWVHVRQTVLLQGTVPWMARTAAAN